MPYHLPGMDPYLEDPRVWPGVHSRLIVYIADVLQPQIGPRYVAAVEERVFVEGPQREIVPDVAVKHARIERPRAGAPSALLEVDEPVLVRVETLEIRETYIEILDRQTANRVVTVIEVTSPANKSAGPGRVSYQAKQQEVLASQAHLVEIDLLRAGTHVLAVDRGAAQAQGNYDYLACVSRAKPPRDLFELYPRTIRERLPRVRVPLAEGDADVALDVQAVLEQTYERGSYAARLDYARPAMPGLSGADEAWLRERVGARQG